MPLIRTGNLSRGYIFTAVKNKIQVPDKDDKKVGGYKNNKNQRHHAQGTPQPRTPA